MTDAVTLAEWTGRGTSVKEVLDHLDGLRRQGQQSLASRTSVVTLVVRATSAVDAWDALATVHRFGGRHPARTVIVVAEPAAAARLDARVSLTTSEAAGHGVWFEDVVLSIGGPASRHLRSLLEPFTLPDLPVAVWYPGGAPMGDDDLTEGCDAVLVDSKMAIGEEGGDAGDDGPVGALPAGAGIEAITSLFGRRAVVDLAWQRLRPWRDLLASLFEGRVFRDHLDGLTSVEVAGKPSARALTAGWLASRLEVRPGTLHLTAARHASIRLRSERDGVMGTFEVARVAGERQVRATATIAGGPSHSDVLSLPDPDLSWSLGEALARLRRDPGYEAALLAAPA